MTDRTKDLRVAYTGGCPISSARGRCHSGRKPENAPVSDGHAGNGGNAGAGGATMAENEGGVLTTSGACSYGILAQTIGGGAGGATISSSGGVISAAYGVGGAGGSGNNAGVRSHLGLRISDSKSKKPLNVRISTADILTFNGFPSRFELRDELPRIGARTLFSPVGPRHPVLR